MPEWTQAVKRRLGTLGLDAQREAEIVAELADHCQELFAYWREQGQPAHEAFARAEYPLRIGFHGRVDRRNVVRPYVNFFRTGQPGTRLGDHTERCAVARCAPLLASSSAGIKSDPHATSGVILRPRHVGAEESPQLIKELLRPFARKAGSG